MIRGLAQRSAIQNIDSIIRFFLYVLIFWLPYGSAVVEVCIVAALILWIIKRLLIFKKESSSKFCLTNFPKAFKPAPSFLNKPIFLFLLCCTVSVLLSSFFDVTWTKFLTKTVEWFVVFFLVVEVFNTKKYIYTALGVLLFTAFSTAVDGLYQYYVSYKDVFMGRTIIPGDRPTAGFKTANGLGGFLTIILLISFSYLFVKFKAKSRRILFLIIFILLAWSSVVTFSRGSWLGISFGFGLFFMLINIYRFDVNVIKKAALIFGVTIFIFFTTLIVSQDTFTQRVSGKWRLNIWKNSLVLIKEKPLFGYGVNTYMSVYRGYQQLVSRYYLENPTYAHNGYIQLTVETGLFGIAAFLSILVALFSKTFESIKDLLSQDYNFMIISLGLLSGIFAFLVHSFFDNNFYSLKLSIYLWYMIGLLVAMNNREGKYEILE